MLAGAAGSTLESRVGDSAVCFPMGNAEEGAEASVIPSDNQEYSCLDLVDRKLTLSNPIDL